MFVVLLLLLLQVAELAAAEEEGKDGSTAAPCTSFEFNIAAVAVVTGAAGAAVIADVVERTATLLLRPPKPRSELLKLPGAAACVVDVQPMTTVPPLADVESVAFAVHEVQQAPALRRGGLRLAALTSCGDNDFVHRVLARALPGQQYAVVPLLRTLEAAELAVVSTNTLWLSPLTPVRPDTIATSMPIPALDKVRFGALDRTDCPVPLQRRAGMHPTVSTTVARIMCVRFVVKYHCYAQSCAIIHIPPSFHDFIVVRIFYIILRLPYHRFIVFKCYVYLISIFVNYMNQNIVRKYCLYRCSCQELQCTDAGYDGPSRCGTYEPKIIYVEAFLFDRGILFATTAGVGGEMNGISIESAQQPTYQSRPSYRQK